MSIAQCFAGGPVETNPHGVTQLVENEMKQSRFIEQIMVIGEGEKMPAALIQLNFEYVKGWIERNEMNNIGDSHEEMAAHPEIVKRIDEEVTFYNERFGKWEKIKKFELTPDVWTIDEGHLTPTMKLKRQEVKRIYKDLYEKIYGHPPK